MPVHFLPVRVSRRAANPRFLWLHRRPLACSPIIRRARSALRHRSPLADRDPYLPRSSSLARLTVTPGPPCSVFSVYSSSVTP
ncbi:uncharacterized protein LAESUDRAFT_227570 [Laetiporus sulphureus 93-53]|uniref:Uncharacterized protein n=1 Tax=Laetiporus sulphureus 93-53 TaxID=1314785 RepID=A0A165DQ28_9APHY|nr:uncharacterized protein LAESUDRAFT_227570 [Laetiporus sulphureus 93-53]KZT05376.1 hypothetical protein LAESUDRAFT_227570 [Laetiporus sulphureus 93-53]